MLITREPKFGARAHESLTGTVYICHLSRPYRHATHYVGFFGAHRTLEQRMAEHRAGRGAALLRVASAVGIRWRVVRLFPGQGLYFERRIKKRDWGPIHWLCPTCTRRLRSLHDLRRIVVEGRYRW